GSCSEASGFRPIRSTLPKPAILSPTFVVIAFDQARIADGFSNDGRRIQILRPNPAIWLRTEKLRTPRRKLEGNQTELIPNRHRARTPRFGCSLVVAASDPHQSALEIEVLPLESAHLAFSQSAVDGDCTKQAVLPGTAARTAGMTSGSRNRTSFD